MIDHLDHIVMTTAHEAECVRFYTEVLGMRLTTFVDSLTSVTRAALCFGHQQIHLYVKDSTVQPQAKVPMPGTLDLCFIAAVPLDEVVARLTAMGITIVEGPVLRTGATSHLHSVFVRDPDLNLIEISQVTY